MLVFIHDIALKYNNPKCADGRHLIGAEHVSIYQSYFKK